MSNKMKGTILGLLGSLVGILFWVILGYIGIISGLAGALMGGAFIIIYKKINSDDTSNYSYIIGSIITIIEIIVAEFITLAVIAKANDVSFSFALSIKDIQISLVIDIVVGLILAGIVFATIIYSQKKKDKQKNDNNVINVKQASSDIIDAEIKDVKINDNDTDKTNTLL